MIAPETGAHVQMIMMIGRILPYQTRCYLLSVEASKRYHIINSVHVWVHTHMQNKYFTVLISITRNSGPRSSIGRIDGEPIRAR